MTTPPIDLRMGKTMLMSFYGVCVHTLYHATVSLIPHIFLCPLNAHFRLFIKQSINLMVDSCIHNQNYCDRYGWCRKLYQKVDLIDDR